MKIRTLELMIDMLSKHPMPEEDRKWMQEVLKMEIDKINLSKLRAGISRPIPTLELKEKQQKDAEVQDEFDYTHR